MTVGPINIPNVEKLDCAAGKDREILWDDGLRGFGVVAFRNGGKCYIVQYRQHGRSRRVRIGEHPALTPVEARKLARKLLGAVEGGSDPIEEKRKARAVPTFGEVADDFMRLHAEAKRKGRTAAEYARLLKLHIRPALGSKRIVDIRRPDIARLQAKLAERPYEANRVLALISVIWNWAAKRDVVAFADNPAKAIETFRECARERYLTTEELGRLGATLADAESVGLPYAVDEAKPKAKHAPKVESRRTRLDPFAMAAIRLLILTGARLREILDARWDQVDQERGILFLSDSKTERKPLYLSAAAQAVLSSIKRVANNPYIIAGASEGAPRSDLNRPWRAVAKAAKLDGVRIHDLRHSFASVGAGASLGLPIIGKLLGHSQAATTQRYAHLDADPMRRAVDTIGATISAALARNSASNVVEMPFAKAGKQ